MKKISTNKINESQINNIIESNLGFVLFEFVSAESGWCIIMLSQIQKIINHNKGMIEHYRINIDNTTSIKELYDINELPKYLLYNKQKLICSFSGLKSLEELKQLITIE